MASPSSPNDSGSSSEDDQKPELPKKVSCQPCRESKVKCLPSPQPNSPCVRCSKLQRSCFYRDHKRGRKPGKIKLQQILRRLEVLDRTLGEIRELNKEVGDEDAGHLVDVLSWQLRRSRFFARDGKGEEFPSRSRATSSSGPSHLAPSEVRKARETSPPGPSSSMQEVGRLSPPRDIREEDARDNREKLPSMERIREPRDYREKLPPPLPREGSGVRGDYSLLVDIEDHASVARVPDEFPTLSNPLKLLAQASSEQERRERSLSQPRHHHSSLKRPRSPSDSPLPPSHRPSHAVGGDDTHQAESASTAVTAGKSTDWASTYFSRGAFHPVYDNHSSLDPIDCGLLTASRAAELIEGFYGRFGTFVHLFDPQLSTLGYIRKHSSFLLTVICALSAEFSPSGDTSLLVQRLTTHYKSMIGPIAAGEYKNVEAAQALFLLASYSPLSASAVTDSTWLYLSTAIRIATELGCNLVCYSYSTPPAHRTSHYQRQLRNTERLWINLWNLEKTLASQTGQRMHLGDEGVIASCGTWDRRELSVKGGDESLVGMVELRRVMIGRGEEWGVLRNRVLKRKVGDAQRSPQAQRRAPERGSEREGEEEEGEREQVELQLSYFRQSVATDLKRWEERWLPSSSSSSSSPLSITGPLSLTYAALVTYALPLPISYSVDVGGELELLYRQCYLACTDYMATFVDRAKRGFMDYITNSFVVSTVYAVVFALDLARKGEAHSPESNGSGSGRGKGREGVDFSFVSTGRVLSLARMTAGELGRVGGGRGGSVAARYAGFLKGVLGRFGESPEEEREEEGRRGFKRGQGTKASLEYSSMAHFASPPVNQPWAAPPNTAWQAAGGGSRKGFVPPHHNLLPTANEGDGISPASWFSDPQWEWMMKDLDFSQLDAGGGGGGGEPILDQMGRLFG